MVRDVEAARELVALTDERGALLGRPRRPIVLAPRRPGARVAAVGRAALAPTSA